MGGPRSSGGGPPFSENCGSGGGRAPAAGGELVFEWMGAGGELFAEWMRAGRELFAEWMGAGRELFAEWMGAGGGLFAEWYKIWYHSKKNSRLVAVWKVWKVWKV
jgi:hypothetical protein